VQALGSSPGNHPPKKSSLGTVTEACNPSYSGGGDQEDHYLKPAQTKKTLGVLVHNCHPSYAGGISRRIEV
jgi:hypothetical protein